MGDWTENCPKNEVTTLKTTLFKDKYCAFVLKAIIFYFLREPLIIFT